MGSRARFSSVIRADLLKQTVRAGKGQTVVAADGVRQAAFEESRSKAAMTGSSRVDLRASHNKMNREA